MTIWSLIWFCLGAICGAAVIAALVAFSGAAIRRPGRPPRDTP